MIPNLKAIPDDSLRRTIIARFSCDNRTAYANLRVGVVNGIVHLAGVVSSIEIRIAAAELAGDVPGVRGVVNRIEAPGAPSPGRRINLYLQNKRGNTDE
jgi:osmotically-inducible protein OsmY